ncbi:hypothetical protein AAVH_24830 [Aphelenchoides avenae]|nr:hypothetical protein AAVH_24830 [Aphelenchus avenae]
MAKQVRPSLQLDNAVNIFACLDRFSLDSIGFTCPTLKGIVDTHLSEEPVRVLESVTIKWHENSLTATMVPESPLGKKMELMAVDDAIKKGVEIDTMNDTDDAMEDEDDDDAQHIGDDDDKDKDDVRAENIQRRRAVLEDAAALCAKSFVKFFKVDEWRDDWRTFMLRFRKPLQGIRIQRLMIVDHVGPPQIDLQPARDKLEQCIIHFAHAVETLLMKTKNADVGDDSLQWLKEHGVRRLAVNDASYFVKENGVRAFCIGGRETADETAPGRSLYLHRANLSFEFLQQLAQECLAADASRMPSITFYRSRDFVPPLPEHLAQARHMKDGHRCLHFRFHAADGPYEIVAHSRGGPAWRVSMRGGHTPLPGICRGEMWFRELEELL